MAKLSELSELLDIGKAYKPTEFGVFRISWGFVLELTKGDSFLSCKALDIYVHSDGLIKKIMCKVI